MHYWYLATLVLPRSLCGKLLKLMHTLRFSQTSEPYMLDPFCQNLWLGIRVELRIVAWGFKVLVCLHHPSFFPPSKFLAWALKACSTGLGFRVELRIVAWGFIVLVCLHHPSFFPPSKFIAWALKACSTVTILVHAKDHQRSSMLMTQRLSSRSSTLLAVDDHL